MFRWLLSTRGEDPLIDTLIKKPVMKFPGHDDSLRVATLARREEAAKLEARAAQLNSGEKPLIHRVYERQRAGG